MKALSIYQPEASLIVRGHLRWNQRRWDPRHRGWLIIHASRAHDHEHRIASWIARGVQFDEDLPYGALVGLVELVAVVRDRLRWVEEQGPAWEWVTRLRWEAPYLLLWGTPRRFVQPIRWYGQPRLFGVPDERLADQLVVDPAGGIHNTNACLQHVPH